MSYNFKKAYHGKNAVAERRKIARSLSEHAQRRARAIAANYAKSAARYVRKKAPQYVKRYGPLVAGAISGMGDYNIDKGYHMRLGKRGYGDAGHMGSRGGHKATVRVTEKGEMEICHSEFIGVLVSSGTTGTTNFVSQNYAINPANPGTFPWLSSVSIGFQSYDFEQLNFEYRPYVSESTSTSSATLTSMGAIAMATQYNSVLGPYTTYQEMAESDYCYTGKPSEHGMMAIECKSKFNPLSMLYVSAQTSLTVGANNSDIRMQNLGIFQIASSNIPIASSTALSLGEIWVHYCVKLFKPQLNAYLGGLQSSHYYGSTATGSPATTTPFGPNVTASVQPSAISNNQLSLTFSTTAFTFPLAITSGNYFICYRVVGSSATLNYAAPTVVNGSLLAVWNNGTLGSTDVGTSAGNATTGTVTQTSFMQCAIVQVSAPGSALCAVTLNTTVIPTAGQFDLFVTPYNFNMT